MNKRVLELADKAVEDIPAGAWNIPDEFCEKFAELIVRECAKVLESGHHPMIDRFTAARYIKQHFGVEE